MNINIRGGAGRRDEEDKREVALVTEEYTELLSRGCESWEVRRGSTARNNSMGGPL